MISSRYVCSGLYGQQTLKGAAVLTCVNGDWVPAPSPAGVPPVALFGVAGALLGAFVVVKLWGR